MSWKQTPLVFNGKSGSEIDIVRESNSNIEREINYRTGRVDKGAGIIGSTLPMIGGSSNIMNLGGNDTFATNSFNGGGIFSGLTSYFTDLVRRDNNSRGAIENFGYTQIALPTLKFPYKAETMRDLHNNGVYVYQYTYSARDIQRIDKLLTRYGKKYIAALTEDMLVPSNTENFVYVRATGVSVTHKTSNNIGENWINNAIAAQLEGGVRIWRVSPINGTV